jgi:hypothetical protein
MGEKAMKWERGPVNWRSYADRCIQERKSRQHAQAIARALLAETDLSPSQVRARWPKDAGWMLEREP